MSRKLQFNIASGVNLSINEEDNTSNLWTEVSYNDFGIYAPVFYENNLYLNITGTFVLPSSTDPITTPATDSTNWRILGFGSHIRDITVEEDANGLVTVTITDTAGVVRTPTTFQSGHIVQNDGALVTHADTINFSNGITAIEDTGVINVIADSEITDVTDDTINGEIDVNKKDSSTVTFNKGHKIDVNDVAQTYEPTLNLFGDYNAIVEDNENKIYSSYTHNIGAGEDLVVLGGLHGRQPSRAIKSLVGGDNVQIVSNEENNGLIISSTGGSIADASDVLITDPQNGDILVRRLITAYFDAAIGTVESGGRMVISFAKNELFTVPTNNPEIDSFSIRWLTSQSANDNIFFLGGNHLDGIDLTMNFTASAITVDNIVDRVIETFDTVTFTSGISWGSSGNLTTHNFVGFGDYVALGTYSKDDSAEIVTGTKAEGYLSLTDTRNNTSSTFDVGIIQFRDYVSIDMESVNITSFNDYFDEYVTRLNANSTFNSQYTASFTAHTGTTGTVKIEANILGTHGNRGISFFIHDRPGEGNNTTDVQPFAGSFEINGGTNDHPAGQIRWTSPKVDTVIPTISATGDVNFVFKQGSHTWHNEQPPGGGLSTFQTTRIDGSYGSRIIIGGTTEFTDYNTQFGNYNGLIKFFGNPTITGTSITSGGSSTITPDSAGSFLIARIDSNGVDRTNELDAAETAGTGITGTFEDGTIFEITDLGAQTATYDTVNATAALFRCYNNVAWTISDAYAIPADPINAGGDLVISTPLVAAAGQSFSAGGLIFYDENGYLFYNATPKTTTNIPGDLPTVDTANWKPMTT